MNPNESPTWEQIDRSIRGLKDFEQENTLLPDSFAGHLERLARIYEAVKPFLTMLALVPFFPPSWRRIIDALSRAIEALVAAGTDGVSARFKAGRDL